MQYYYSRTASGILVKISRASSQSKPNNVFTSAFRKWGPTLQHHQPRAFTTLQTPSLSPAEASATAETGDYLEPDTMASKNDSGKQSQQLKVPKGTRDWIGSDILIRDHIFKIMGDVFKRHGGTPLDTPVFELKEILTGKYGEDSKLIYDLADQGGEISALRYDLTVPLARWLAMNNVQNIKRYQIAKVYRRDQPAMAKGRLREFYQCDFDVVGQYDAMIPDAEILCVITEVFEALGIEKDITIKLNHRKILDGIFGAVGVPESMTRAISSAVDKLDKLPWAEVKKEMEEKGLATEVADKIGNYVKHKGGRDIVELIEADAQLSANPDIIQGVSDMKSLFRYADAFGIADRISFDLSLARGLDYYTGLIYEVVTEASAPKSVPENVKSKDLSKLNLEDKAEDQSKNPSIGVGSIAAGGRYDNLVGMFGKRQIPCVGISFGVDRIFTILKTQLDAEKELQASSRKADVFVMAFGGKGFTGLLDERMAIARLLWKAGIKTEFAAKEKPRLPQQFKAAETAGVPLAVILGDDELAAGKVKVKVMGATEGPDKDGRLIAKDDLVSEVKKLLQTGDS